MDNLVNWRMHALQGKKEIVVGSKVSQAEYDTLQKICDTEDRSMSYVLRELAMRGLVQYFHDGKLKTDDKENSLIVQAATKGMSVSPQDAKPITLGNHKEVKRSNAAKKKRMA